MDNTRPDRTAPLSEKWRRRVALLAVAIGLTACSNGEAPALPEGPSAMGTSEPTPEGGVGTRVRVAVEIPTLVELGFDLPASEDQVAILQEFVDAFDDDTLGQEGIAVWSTANSPLQGSDYPHVSFLTWIETDQLLGVRMTNDSGERVFCTDISLSQGVDLQVILRALDVIGQEASRRGPQEPQILSAGPVENNRLLEATCVAE